MGEEKGREFRGEETTCQAEENIGVGILSNLVRLETLFGVLLETVRMKNLPMT
jgi:hypothetical protein